jgi:hypothetical protein
MSDYKKYLKYKSKYLNLKNSIIGGTIGEIDITKLNEVKSHEEVPKQIKNYVNMITIPKTKVIRVGSSMNRIQPFYSDVDIMNIININITSDKLVKYFIENIKNMVKKIVLDKNIFFSDFKAAGLHWNIQEILNERNGELSLYDAIFVKNVVKIDIIVPYDERYLEMSTFFILKSLNEYINVKSDYFSTFKDSLLVDIEEYQKDKPFKAVNRVWSLSTISNDLDTLNKLKELIKSNVALLAQINSDIETINILIQKNLKYDKEFVINELYGFKERCSNILDLGIDLEKVNLRIDNTILLFQTNNIELSDIIVSLTKLHDYLLTIINKETNEYLSKINFEFPKSNKINDSDTNTDIIESFL